MQDVCSIIYIHGTSQTLTNNPCNVPSKKGKEFIIIITSVDMAIKAQFKGLCLKIRNGKCLLDYIINPPGRQNLSTFSTEICSSEVLPGTFGATALILH